MIRAHLAAAAAAEADDADAAVAVSAEDEFADSQRRRRRGLHALALLLLVALVFGRVLGHEFVNLDDDKFLYANPNFLPPTIAGLADHWRHPYRHLYAPVAMTAWWVVAQFGLISDPAGGAGAGGYALNPWVFHAASVLVHAANVLLVWRLVSRLLRDDLAALFAAAVFAVHPVQVEAVAWASEMKDLLVALFSLLAIVAALRATCRESESRPRAAWWAAAVICYAAALLSKPSAVTLPVVVAVVLWLCGASRRVLIGVITAGVVIAAPAAMLARWAQPAPSVVPPPPAARVLVAGDALAFYLEKIFWPARVGVDYGRTPAAVFASGAAYWTWIIPMAVTILALVSRRRALLAAWLIFLAALATVLGLLPFDWQAVSTVADHYLYLAMLGVALAAGWIFGAVTAPARAARPKVIHVAAAAIVLVLAALSLVNCGHWSDSIALWRHATDVNPRSGLAYGNWGAALLDTGDAAAALPLLARAAELDPRDPFAHLNLARARLSARDPAGAALSALDMVAANRRRADFNAAVNAAVLERFATAVREQGDAASAARLLAEAARLRGGAASRPAPPGIQ